MSFGKWSGEGGRSLTTAAALFSIAATLTVSLTGCGGGGGSSSPSATPSPGQASGSTATITGTVLDPESNLAPDANAVVAFGKYYAITAANGSFSITIPSGTAGQLIVYGRAVRDANNNIVVDTTTGLPTSDNYYTNTGYYPASSTSTTSQVALLSTGIPITALSAGQVDALGTIGLLTTNDPPPPPNI
jgi:hypothetical protein